MQATTRNTLLGGGAAVILVAALCLLLFRSGPRPEYPSDKVVHAVDLRTGEEVVLHTAMKEQAPYVNEETGRRTLYPWYICWECKHRFVPELVPANDGGPPRLPMIPACGNCGSAEVSPWSPELSELIEPVGDAPLPSLP